LRFARFNLDGLRLGHRTVTEVEANWKILIENYNECLHCPTVHPELVAVIPAFRKGAVLDPKRTDGGVAIANGGNSFSESGRSSLPPLPGMTPEDETSLYGCTVYPNMFIDVTGSGAISTLLMPRSPDHTTVVSEYLFPPEVIAGEGFDPSEIVEFVELVAHQDYVVCERGAARRALAGLHARGAGREGRPAGCLQHALPGGACCHPVTCDTILGAPINPGKGRVTWARGPNSRYR
jgi:Rieske 2Fe-2S family protein